MRPLLRFVLPTVMVSIGLAHFVRPEPFVDIVPSFLPEPRLLVYVSGFFEVLGGLGLLVERTRRFAAWGLVALYVAVFPANVNMAVNEIVPAGTDPLPIWALWARLPLQLGFIAWAYTYTRPRSVASQTMG